MGNMPQKEPFSASKITWAALLAHWVQFARGALALPSDEQADRIGKSVPDIIMLQAVWFALDDLEGLAGSERALALDRAEILIDKHSQAIIDRWPPKQLTPPANLTGIPTEDPASTPAQDNAHTLPPALEELIGDARDRLESTLK
jgi:hypothetical protein